MTTYFMISPKVEVMKKSNFSNLPQETNFPTSKKSIINKIQEIDPNAEVYLFDNKNNAIEYAQQLAQFENNSSWDYYLSFNPIVEVTLISEEGFSQKVIKVPTDSGNSNEYTATISNRANLATMTGYYYCYGKTDSPSTSDNTFSAVDLNVAPVANNHQCVIL